MIHSVLLKPTLHCNKLRMSINATLCLLVSIFSLFQKLFLKNLPLKSSRSKSAFLYGEGNFQVCHYFHFCFTLTQNSKEEGGEEQNVQWQKLQKRKLSTNDQ